MSDNNVGRRVFVINQGLDALEAIFKRRLNAAPDDDLKSYYERKITECASVRRQFNADFQADGVKK